MGQRAPSWGYFGIVQFNWASFYHITHSHTQDIGDGWWEGQLDNGEIGLFPESYVEMIDDGAVAGATVVGMGQHDGYGQVSVLHVLVC